MNCKVGKRIPEVWKTIPLKELEGFFEASNYGRVRSIDRFIEYSWSRGKTRRDLRKGKVLKPTRDIKNGLYYLQLNVNGNHYRYTVARLVAFTFLKTPENPKRFVVKQKDGIPSHNNPLNLKWVHYYEWQDNNYKRQGIRNPASKFEQQDLFVIKQLLSTGNFTTSEIAEKYNVSRGAIENILNNKSYNQGVKPC